MQTVLDQVQEEEKAYTMPPANQGMCVTYYPPHVLDKGGTSIGFITKISRSKRTVDIYVPNQGYFELARHITDPKLKLGGTHAENGAWDYSPDWKATQERISDLAGLVNDLSKTVEALSTKGRKKDPE